MISKNSETSDSYRLLLNLTDKIKLKRSDKYDALSLYQTLAFAIYGKILKDYTKTINSRHQVRHEMKSLTCLMDLILYQICKTTWDISLKTWKKKTYNSLMRTFKNKIVNRNTFRIKTEYYLELLSPKTMKLFGSTITKITKGRNVEISISISTLRYC